MHRLSAVFVLAWLGATGLQAQVEQLATSGDGSVLVFHSYFRLQTEPEFGPQGKIYRWQDGVWTRVAAAPSSGFATSPPDVFDPFLSTDASIIGWQTSVGCVGLCQIIVRPPLSSEVPSVSLPATFPRGTIRMSPNGRYFTADSYPFSGAQYLDVLTGLTAEVPVDVFARPVVREIADDGTALLLITHPQYAGQSNGPGVLSLWKPGASPQPIYSDSRVLEPKISGNGAMVAMEAVAEDGSRTVLALDTRSGERFSVAAMPSKKYGAFLDSFAKPRWDANGSQLLYRSYDEQVRPVALSLWDAASRTSRVLLTNAEGFADAAISGDGATVWAVTASNRLLRLDLVNQQTQEILSPLGSSSPRGAGDGVPGSAFLIPGQGFTKAQTVLDGGQQLPVVDTAPEGLWVQIPWEYSSLPRSVHQVLVRSDNNPFEAVIPIPIVPEAEPRIAIWVDPPSGNSYAKAVHQDFQDLVTPANPARPGELIHVYLTGLGPLDGPLPTGAPGPLTPLLHPVTPLRCALVGSTIQPLAMPYLGYAVGLVGIYQADVTIPSDVTMGTQQLLCRVTNPSGNVFSSVAPLSTASAP